MSNDLFDSWHFEAEYPRVGFGIRRLIQVPDRRPSLDLRIFGEQYSLSGKDYKISDVTVSFVQLKRLAREMLPGSSNLRTLILSEPDIQPRWVAMGKVEVFCRLLHQELDKH